MRLDYIKQNYKKIRIDVYQGVVDALHRSDSDASNVGKRIILPASFTAGPRYPLQNYQDATVICKHYGYPELFITFTCKAKWPEIVEALKLIKGQRVKDMRISLHVFLEFV